MRKSTRREIFSSIGRFFAIFAIIAIGVAFFSGIRVTRDTMLAAGDKYITLGNMFDFRVVSPVGVNSTEVDRFLDVDGVLFAEGAYVEDALTVVGAGEESVYRFHSIGQNINKLNYLYGGAPQTSSECVLDGRFFGEEFLGKEVTVTDNNSDETKESFSERKFTVVGIATSPYYLNYERGTTKLGNGSVAAFVYLTEDAFISSDGVYDEVFIDYDISGEMYSDEYNDALEIASDKISAACVGIFKERTTDEMAKLKVELLKKEADLNESEKSFLAAKSEAEVKLSETLAELDAAKGEYDKAKEALDKNLVPLTQSRDQLKIVIDALEKQLSIAPDAEKTEINYNLTKYRYQLAEVEAALAPMLAFKENAESVLKEINDGYSEYNKAKDTLASESDKTAKEIADAREEIRKAIEYTETTIEWKDLAFTRLYNTGYVCFENDTEIVNAIGKIFPAFFFAVAVLVCMTTMTRMVEEQRIQIGTFKALGLKKREIRGKYVTYAGIASFLGCGAGFALGTKFLPCLIWNIYTIMYDFSASVDYVFDPIILAISLAASLLCSIGVTVYCLKRSFAASPAELMRPTSPGNGGRILLEGVGFIWRRLSFLHKVTARNIFRYKKRMFMMILGIGGCTALLLTGFGMYDSICNIVDYQYDDVTVYDVSTVLKDAYSDDEKFGEDFAAAYDDISEYLFVHQSAVDVKLGENVKSANMLVSSDKDVDSFIKLSLDGENIAFPNIGEAVVNTGLAESLGIKVGDKITLTDSDYNSYSFRISGVFANYVSNYVILSADTFKEAGGDVEYNSVLINHKDGVDPLAFGAKLSASENALSVTVTEQVKERTSAMLDNMVYLILIVVVSAGALAFVVLYNLTNINITERVREIATLRVLGYHKNECCRYIFRENNILTLVGAIVGIPLGIALHAYCMDKVKVDMIRFEVQISWLSFILAVVVTLLFALLVNLFMRRKITSIEMATSLKSVE